MAALAPVGPEFAVQPNDLRQKAPPPGAPDAPVYVVTISHPRRAVGAMHLAGHGKGALRSWQ